jgi:putative transposase
MLQKKTDKKKQTNNTPVKQVSFSAGEQENKQPKTKKKLNKKSLAGKELFAVKYRLYPNEGQEQFFINCFGCVRKYWNLALEDRNKDYKEYSKLNEQEKKEYIITTNTPAHYKKMKEYYYLKNADSLALANAQLNLNQAFKNFFEGKANKPKNKKKYLHDSYTTNNQIVNNEGTVRFIDDRHIKLPKIKEPVIIKKHRHVEADIRSVTISRTPTGKYYASVLYIVDKIDTDSKPITKVNIGIDFGVKHFITDSEGLITDSIRAFRDLESKLKKEKIKLSRKYESAKARKVNLSECSNYQKQKKKVAEVYEKMANIRSDILHKLSKYYTDNYDIIGIEDLNIKGMMKNRHLSKAISDAGWNRFVNMLEYKAKRKNKHVIKVSRWFASTQTCSSCGCILQKQDKLTLKDRDWTCPECGAHHDRDINAAINIKNEAVRLYHSQLNLSASC